MNKSRSKPKFETHRTTKGTAHEEGTGLGLMICKEMVKRNGVRSG